MSVWREARAAAFGTREGGFWQTSTPPRSAGGTRCRLLPAGCDSPATKSPWPNRQWSCRPPARLSRPLHKRNTRREWPRRPAPAEGPNGRNGHNGRPRRPARPLPSGPPSACRRTSGNRRRPRARRPNPLRRRRRWRPVGPRAPRCSPRCGSLAPRETWLLPSLPSPPPGPG